MVLRGVAWCPVVSREKIGACGALSCVVSWLSCGEIDSEIDSDIDGEIDSEIGKNQRLRTASRGVVPPVPRGVPKKK